MTVRNDQKKVLQNLSWVDRSVRFVIGLALLFVPMLMLTMSSQEASWHIGAFIVSFYPILTALIGWDPVYQLFKVRSCGDSKENSCGTFPFQVASAMHKNPKPKSDLEHSLETSEMDNSAKSH